MPSAPSTRLKPWMLVAAIWLWPAVFNVLNRVVQGRLQGWDPPTAVSLFFTFGDWIAYAIVTPFIFRVSARWPVVRPHVVRRFLVHLCFALLFCLVWAVVGKVLQAGLMALLEPEALRSAMAKSDLRRVITTEVASWILTTIPFGVVVYTTVAAMAHAIGYFSEARDREVQLARVSEQLTTARFAALQAQLNPHFMFNTLNTVAVLARDGDRVGAVRVIEHLSALLRRTLSRHRSSEVTLDEELALVEAYLAIEQARFVDRLRPEVSVPAELRSAAVPDFGVQHLVENAVRHGIARREDAGRLQLTARRDGATLEVTVVDDGPGIGSVVPPAGHGIENTRERLKVLYGSAASLTVLPAEGGGTIATLRVPYRELTAEGDHDSR
ncbi:MAG: histidine kinase [Gemmatimonadaceae bacterium]